MAQKKKNSIANSMQTIFVLLLVVAWIVHLFLGHQKWIAYSTLGVVIGLMISSIFVAQNG